MILFFTFFKLLSERIYINPKIRFIYGNVKYCFMI